MNQLYKIITFILLINFSICAFWKDVRDGKFNEVVKYVTKDNIARQVDILKLTPLGLAISKGHCQIVNFLIQKAQEYNLNMADFVNKVDNNYNRTALHYAILGYPNTHCSNLDTKFNLVKKLITLGVNIQAKDRVTAEDGSIESRTALEQAKVQAQGAGNNKELIELIKFLEAKNNKRENS